MPDRKQEVARRIEQLRAEIRRHDYLYFVENNPEISDREYDRLVENLRSLERDYPDLVTPDSPTQRVGEQPLEGFAHVTHDVPMLSIDNTYNEEELRKFDQRVRKALGGAEYNYVVDPKIDGVAVSLRYEGGRYALGATRGDGRTGDDITANLKTLRSIPMRLRGDDWPEVLEVRGEVYWPRSDFIRTNRQRAEAGQEPFKNPRNAAAGTLKQLDPRLVAQRRLVFCAHGFGRIEPFPQGVERYRQLIERVREWGIPTSPHTRRCDDLDQVLSFVHEWESERLRLDFETDGLVVKINQIELREGLGATSKAPRWCIAYKYAAEQAQTRLVSVEFQVGRTGTVTPRATFEPVELSGTTVTHASLHNFDQVRRLDVHVGDLVTIEKAGEIIPQVVNVDATRRPKDAEPIEPPRECPECGGDVVKDEGGVYLRCIDPACPAQRLERLKFFCWRDQMDIDGAGEAVIEKLVEHGLVKTYADLYRLPQRRDELVDLPVSVNSKTGSPIRLGEKRADKLIQGIEQSRKRPLARVLSALGIRHVGGNTAELLAAHFGSIDAIAEAGVEDLQEVDGVGPEVAASVRQWFDSDAGRRTIEDLRSVGVNMAQPRARAGAKARVLDGKTFVITGTLEKYSRKQIEDLIKRRGGKTTGGVSGNTDYLVVGQNPGSKLDKARSLGVRTLSEAEFEQLISD